MLARSRVATVWRGLRWRSPKSFRIPTLNEGYTELFNSKKGGWKMNTRNVLMLFLSIAKKGVPLPSPVMDVLSSKKSVMIARDGDG